MSEDSRGFIYQLSSPNEFEVVSFDGARLRIRMQRQPQEYAVVTFDFDGVSYRNVAVKLAGKEDGGDDVVADYVFWYGERVERLRGPMAAPAASAPGPASRTLAMSPRPWQRNAQQRPAQPATSPAKPLDPRDDPSRFGLDAPDADK